MFKHFETTSDYEAYINGEGVVLPNVSVAKDAPKIVYYNPIFFVKLSLDNGEVVELQGSGELTKAMVRQITRYQTSIVRAEIGELCTTIGSDAFLNCDGLTSITIPDSVTSIGDSAFYGCEGLTSITIPNTVTSIGGYTFSICRSLTSVSIPDSVTNIDSYAFKDCTGLTSITIPDSVTSIGDSAFYGCEGLTSIVVNSANTVFDSRDNCNAIINTSTNELIVGCKNTVIPDGVTSIGNNAFNHCTGLTSITIPNSVTSIDGDAFNGCSGLTSITSLAATAPTIESSTFRNVKTGGTLTVPRGSTGYDVWMGTGNYYLGKYGWVIPFFAKLYLNNGKVIELQSSGELTQAMITPYKSSVVGAEFGKLCTSIGNGAFTECTGLTSVTIPNSVTSIDQEAFRNCTGLTSITCNAITAPTIQSNTFQNVKTGGTLTVPSGSTGYDVWMGTGNYYLGKYGWVIPFLAKLSLNNGKVVELQGSGELTQAMVSQYSSSLVSAEIGESCTSIGEWAFMGCQGLTSITCNAITAPTIQSNTFQSVKTGGTLRVPSGSTGYDEWMNTLRFYYWTKVEQ